MANVIIVELSFSARMAIIAIEKLTLRAWVAFFIIFKFPVVTFMTSISVVILLALRALMALLMIIVCLGRWALVALSIVQEWGVLRTLGDSWRSKHTRKHTLITMSIVFGAFLAFTIIEMLFVLRATVAGSILILILEFFGTTTGIDERIPYFGRWAVSAIPVLIQLVG